MNNSDYDQVVDFCRKNIDLNQNVLGNEYDYNSLPLCVIDAIYSINSNYNSTKKVVETFCSKTGCKKNCEKQLDFQDDISIDYLLNLFQKYGTEKMIEEYFNNRQRTSTSSGIRKGEAVKLFCEVLSKFNVKTFRDVKKIECNKEFENEIRKIPGQNSGLSLSYFLMLAGSDDLVKPDRMVIQFCNDALGDGRKVTTEEVSELLINTSKILKKEYSKITPKRLDHLIWRYQREKNKARKAKKTTALK